MNCFSKIFPFFFFWSPKIKWGFAAVAPKDAPPLLVGLSSKKLNGYLRKGTLKVRKSAKKKQKIISLNLVLPRKNNVSTPGYFFPVFEDRYTEPPKEYWIQLAQCSLDTTLPVFTAQS
jgi:hypothetical protein